MSYIEHICRTHTISTQNAYYIFKQGHYTTEGIWSCLCQRGIRMLRSFTVSVLLSLRSHKEGLYGPVTHPPPSVRVYEPFIPTQWVFMNLHSHIVGHWTLHSKRVDLWSLHSHTAGLWLYTPTVQLQPFSSLIEVPITILPLCTRSTSQMSVLFSLPISMVIEMETEDIEISKLPESETGILQEVHM